MIVYTDSVRFAQALLQNDLPWEQAPSQFLSSSLQPYLETLAGKSLLHSTEFPGPDSWGYAVLIENAEESQFDALNRVARVHDAPSTGLVCVAGVGKKFHGFKDRPWEAARGNLHLSALVSPRRRIEHVGVAFTILAVVSVLQTVDDLGKLPRKAAVKWVNDIMIDGAKIGGVLATCQIQDEIVEHATIGIGLNIEKAPRVSPTPFVPKTGSLQQFSSDPPSCTLRLVFQKLITYLGANYVSLLAGGYSHLLEFYRSRSLVLGRRIRLHRDSSGTSPGTLLEGVVLSIGDDLELTIDQAPSPVAEGRLELLTR